MNKWLARMILRMAGWRLGPFPTHLRRAVLVVGPHTSTWDFPIALLARIALGIHVKFVGKAELFKPPFGFLFRYWGGIPVRRVVKEDTVSVITRCFVPKLRTGFYYIAAGAGVPIVLVGMDFHKKTIEAGPLIPPGLGERETLSMVVDYFSKVRGRHPEKGIGPEHLPK